MDPAAPQIKRLLYIESAYDVDVYNYATGKQVGTLTGFDGGETGMCVDASGDVWIAGAPNGTVVEYAHGGKTQLQSLSAGPFPTWCSINPLNGDLAVSNFGIGLGFVQIFKHAKGNTQHTYSSNVCGGPAALGYDNKGNLFIEAYNFASRIIICELPSRSSRIQVDSFDSPIDLPGGVMWDGKFVMIADRQSVGYTNLYQVKSPHKGFVKTVGTTTLTGQGCRASYVFEPFVVGAKNTPVNDVQATTVVGAPPGCYPARVNYWAYPGGGNPQKTLSYGPSNPGYEAVSIAP